MHVGPSLDPTPCPYFHLQVKHPLRDWSKISECQKVIQHRPKGGWYRAVAVNSEGLLAVADAGNMCHLLSKDGALVKSIGEGVLVVPLVGIAFDVKENVWVTEWVNYQVRKLSQDGRLLQTIHYVGCDNDHFNSPAGVSVSTEGLIYICDCDNHRVTVHDEEGKFLFTFGSKGSGPG